ncbi:MAG: S8 family peptidase [Acidobacteriota bacterium]|jgi:subtilisin family serine protease
MMRNTATWSLLAILFLGMTIPAAAADERPLFVPGEILVKFRAGVPEIDRARLLDGFGLRPVHELLGTRAQKLRLPAGIEPREAARRLRERFEIEYAEPNYYRYLDFLPNDPGFPELYALDNQGQTGGTVDADIDAPEAWDITTGSADVLVGVLDSGMDLDHQDLLPNLFMNPGEIFGNGIDDDGNGFIDDVAGWDFVDDDNNANDPAAACAGHGTHTAGTIGAVGNNGIGVVGVSPNVRILPVRAFKPVLVILCSAEDADLIDGIGYMTMMGVDISNNSWGGGPFSQAVFDAIARARHLFVSSAGNSGVDMDTSPAYPASYDMDHIIGVGATDHNDDMPAFSNFGRHTVEIAAPGAGILSTVRNNDYGLLDGTSMSSPHVAGAAALLLSQDPDLTPGELRARLMLGADHVGIPVIGGNRLNAFNALTLPPPTVEVTVTPTGPTSLSPGDTAQMQVAIENHAGTSQTVDARLWAWTPGGARPVLLGPASLTLSPGQVMTVPFSQSLPPTLPPGEYWVIAQATDGRTTFDESRIVLQVN